MAVGALPQNQIDALPLLTVAQAQQASTVIRGGGGQILKMFTPADLGFVNLTPTNIAGSGKFGLVATNYVDVSFCTRFSAIIRRTISDNTAQVAMGFGGILTVQHRAFPGDTPPAAYLPAGALRDDMIGITQIGTVLTIFPAIGIGETQSLPVCWSDNVVSGTGVGNATTIGGDVRFIFSWNTNNPGGGAANLNLFNMWLEAQS
jgi:hypothetical protein